MKKKLNTEALKNELRGSAFFPTPPPHSTTTKEEKERRPIASQSAKQRVNNNTVIPRYHDTTVSSLQDDPIEAIRKAVKQLGKEAATYRFTQEEKKALADIVYQYKGRRTRTSENEITRIAINFLVEDYRKSGKNSVVAQVLERLNA